MTELEQLKAMLNRANIKHHQVEADGFVIANFKEAYHIIKFYHNNNHSVTECVFDRNGNLLIVESY